MTNDMLLNGSIRPGHPLRLVETGEEVYFRSARFSPHAEEVLAIVADIGGGTMAVTAEEIDHMHYEDDHCQCARCQEELGPFGPDANSDLNDSMREGR